jgi:quinol monooxygenase YgiN
MILITAKVAVTPNDRQAFCDVAETQVRNSRSEEGCLDYGYFEDAMAPGKFIFLERWKDQAALDFHFAQSYCLDFMKSARKLTTSESPIEIHHIAETTTP